MKSINDCVLSQADIAECKMRKASYESGFFADIAFTGKVKKCKFTDCTFVNCRFEASFTETLFENCRFYNSELNVFMATTRACSFIKCRFGWDVNFCSGNYVECVFAGVKHDNKIVDVLNYTEFGKPVFITENGLYIGPGSPLWCNVLHMNELPCFVRVCSLFQRSCEYDKVYTLRDMHLQGLSQFEKEKLIWVINKAFPKAKYSIAEVGVDEDGTPEKMVDERTTISSIEIRNGGPSIDDCQITVYAVRRADAV